jgi:hypothetical protein
MSPGPEFFQTRMGHTFYESTMPNLVKQLKRLNDNLEKLVKTQEDKTGDKRRDSNLQDS